MSLIDDIKRDQSAGTPGPWWTRSRYNGTDMGCAIIAVRTDSGQLPGNPTRGMVGWASAILNTEARKCEANARRIARVPDMEAALIAAERLADAAHATIHDDCDTSLVDALAAYRAATRAI
jgi:hypothetical protein